jgi:glycosyltransferase involved in cell wall biosynthesis
MKILYLFLDGTRSTGVLSKVKNKIEFLNKLGLDVTGIFMNQHIKEREEKKEEKIVYLPLVIQPLAHWYNRRFIRNFRTYFARRNYIKQFYRNLKGELLRHQYDLILLRYPLSNRELYNFMRSHSHQVVFEHNSKELVEMALDLATKPGMKHVIASEEKFGSEVLKLALGLTGVGKEITAYEVERSGRPDIPHAVIPNGVGVDKYIPRSHPGIPIDEIKMLLVTGSPSPWVGLDIALNSLRQYSGEMSIHLFIVGPIGDELKKSIKESGLERQVTCTGELSSIELDKFYNQCHIAIGTLAMQRVGLNEHSSLKVLEYAARGIPFVIGYDETNFPKGTQIDQFIFRADYNGSAVDLKPVVQFAIDSMKHPDHPETMHNWAKRNIDFSVQMQKLKIFLSGLQLR